MKVQAKVTDDRSGVQRVTALVSYPDGESRVEAMHQQNGTDVWAVTFTAQWDTNKVGTDPTKWFVQVTIEATDRAGNQARSPETRIRVAAAPPPPPF
ncbi:MAG: hypothetical protein ACUVTP_10955 [Candidatus Fervidibacter sp.]|uniref:hypothetical protein n=1 Tax=Candidatus Fervidibacter sp. TaxID=3100871 RepID=UPI004049787E